VTDTEVLPNLLEHLVIKEISRDSAYNTRECNRATRTKKAIPIIHPHECGAYGKRDIHAIWWLVARNSMGQTKNGNRSMVTTGVHCPKPPCIALNCYLVYHSQCTSWGETYVMIKELNKLTGIGMPEIHYATTDLASIRL